MGKPKVSVLMSNFNGADFIGKTIESVINQTFKDFEFIIIDDCSTDNSREIIDSFDDPRIRKIYFEHNEHLIYALNFGIDNSNGEYIARIDSDDMWEPEKLAKQVEYMDNNLDCGACFTLVNVIDENGKKLSSLQCDRVDLFKVDNCSREEWIRRFYFFGSCLCHPSVVMRKSAIDKVGKYNYSLVQIQDYEMWVRIAKKYPIYVLQEPLINYRWHSNNVSMPTEKAVIRSNYEFSYVLSGYFDDMTDAEFANIFKEDFLFKNNLTHDELECEKMLMLLKPVFCGYAPKLGGIRKFSQLLENDAQRSILREKYGITQKNFYEISASPVLYQPIAEFDLSKEELVKLLAKKISANNFRLNQFFRKIYSIFKNKK